MSVLQALDVGVVILVLMVAGDPDLARRIKADGVHWPERMLGRRPNHRGLATASAHSRSALVRAQRAGMEAAILSTVFDSASPSAGRPIGALRFRQLVRASPLPVYALGGINAGNAAHVRAAQGARAAGWAAVDAILEAFGPA